MFQYVYISENHLKKDSRCDSLKQKDNSMGEIYQICTKHFGCIDCPVLMQSGLHHDNEVTICEKVEREFYRNANSNQA